jgi:carboxyl-terminal processing protease
MFNNVYALLSIVKILKKSQLLTAITALAIGTVGLTATGIHLTQAVALSSDNSQEAIDEVWQVVNRRYVDGSFNQNDWKSIRSQYLGRNYADREQVYGAIKEMLKKLGDPYTRFMTPQEFKDFKVQTSGQLVGVGFQLNTDEKTKKLVVVSTVEGAAAAKAGITADDIILQIDGVSTTGMEIGKAVQLIRGQVDTNVTLTIEREGNSRDYILTRQKIEIHSVEAKYEPTDGGFGYIRLKQFSANAPSEMRAAIKKLENQGAKGYILDLRSNPGGLLYGAIDISRMLMNDGKIVSTKLRQGGEEIKSANQTALIPDKPIVVLVDGGSASASEILSGALQDNKRAELVGMKTYGKGLVQSVVPLSGGTGMAVTIARYYTPKGTDINHKGIEPDVEVQLTKAQMQALRKDTKQIGTDTDLQYVKALELLKTKIVSFDN